MKRIGFFGGCVTHQHNIPPESLFHAALRQSAGNYTLAFGHYLSFDQLVPSLSKFLEMHELETLYLFVRPFPLPPLHKLVVKYEDANGKARHALHPAFFKRELQWDEALSKHQVVRPFNNNKQPFFGLHDVNVWLGALFGLHRWAQQFVVLQLHEVLEVCNAKGVELRVVSTPPNRQSWSGERMMRQISEMVERWCDQHHIRYLSVMQWSDAHFGHAYHFSLEGHQRLGALILNDLRR